MKDVCICPRCGGEKYKTVESRTHSSGIYEGLRIRRKQCAECGWRWITVEITYFDFLDLQRRVNSDITTSH